jgi:hypothetical protein
MAKVIRAIFRSLPTITGITDTRPFLKRGFWTTATTIAPIARIGTDNLDRNQFRSFMIYIHNYVKIWELLLQKEPEVKGHLTLPEFEGALAWLQQWGFKEAKFWDRDPAAAFHRLSGGSTVVPVEEFIDRCMNGAMVDLCHDGAEDEREMATRMLKRLHPHLVADNPPKKWQGLTFIGSALPVPPPGQKRPPPQPVSESLLKPNKRWTTQYMVDFESPSRLVSQAPSRPESRGSNTEAPSRRGEMAKGHAAPTLKRAESLPQMKQTLRGLDREELRKKLEAHVETTSTPHLRKILRVAGDIALDKTVSFSPSKSTGSIKLAKPVLVC